MICMISSLFFVDSNDEVKILLIGKTQVGKSTTGNIILGRSAFHAKVSASSVTDSIECRENERFGKRLVVVDTPGLFHAKLSEKEIRTEYCNLPRYISSGIHAIVLVFKVDRLTEEDETMVKFFMKLFGDKLKDYLIVVFTHKYRLELIEMSLENLVKTINKSSNLHKLIDKNMKLYIALGYTGDIKDSESEARKLLSMIESIGERNGGRYYSTDLRKKALQDIEDVIYPEETEFIDGCFCVI